MSELSVESLESWPAVSMIPEDKILGHKYESVKSDNFESPLFIFKEKRK